MALETVYLETSVISYLVSNPSRNLIVAANQQISHDWWNNRRAPFDCYVSSFVIDEISAGNPIEAQKRLNLVNKLPLLDATVEVEHLTKAILSTGIFSQRSIRDASHIAVATIHQMNYLVTWNCKHLANARLALRIKRVCESQGYVMPQICTPLELMGEDYDAE